MGRTIGVMHLQGEAGEVPDEPEQRHFTAVAAHVGTRLGVIRTLADTQRAARTDPLTGLFNRRTFEALATPKLQSAEGGLLVMADMDRFKKLNDTHGHQVGDRAIVLFSKIMKAALPEPNIVARYGGEEFILLLPGVSREEGVALLEDARASLAQALEGGSLPTFTCSMGVAQYPIDGDDLEGLIKLSDAALYQAKKNCRDRIELAGRRAHGATRIHAV